VPQPTDKTEQRGQVPALHLVDIATVADYLGVNVRYVRRLVADREIPYIKWRHLLRFDLAVIARWVDQSRHGEERPADRRPTARP
jgi:excisionase family DNA binding protein